MRTFGFVVLALVVGLVAGFAVTVVAGFAWMHYAGVFDRDGGISMSVFFGLGPIGAIVAGVIAATLTFLRIRRHERLVAARTRPPTRRWPLGTRVVVAAIVWGVGAWLVMRGDLLAPFTDELRDLRGGACRVATSHSSCR